MMIQVKYLERHWTFKIPKSVTWFSSFSLSVQLIRYAYICCGLLEKGKPSNFQVANIEWRLNFTKLNSEPIVVCAIAKYKFYFWFSIFSSGKFNRNPSIWGNRSAWTFRIACTTIWFCNWILFYISFFRRIQIRQDTTGITRKMLCSAWALIGCIRNFGCISLGSMSSGFVSLSAFFSFVRSFISSRLHSISFSFILFHSVSDGNNACTQASVISVSSQWNQNMWLNYWQIKILNF